MAKRKNKQLDLIHKTQLEISDVCADLAIEPICRVGFSSRGFYLIAKTLKEVKENEKK